MSVKNLLTGAAPAIFVLLWSTGFVGAKMGAPSSNPFSFLLVRFVIVAAILGIFCLFANVRWPNRTDALQSMLTGFLVHGAYLGGVFWAIDNGMPAGVSAIIVGLQPLITVATAKLILDESITPRHLAGFGFGLLGLGLVLAPKLGLSNTGVSPVTILACFAGVLGISIGTVYQKRFLNDIDLRTGTFYQYIGALPLMIVGLPFDGGYYIEWTGDFIFALAWLVLVLSIGAISLLMLLIRQGAVSSVASLFYLVPVATAIESYFLFGETLTTLQIIGMLIVVGAVALARKKA
ncbi:MAG: DMT family transporter [Stappiaceae bacterium]